MVPETPPQVLRTQNSISKMSAYKGIAMSLILYILGREDDTFFPRVPNCRRVLLNKIDAILLIIRNRDEGLDAKVKE